MLLFERSAILSLHRRLSSPASGGGKGKCFQSLALARLACGGAAAQPHLLEIIERTNLGPEDMNNHVAGVDQHPIAMGKALDSDAGEPSATKALQHLLGHRPSM